MAQIDPKMRFVDFFLKDFVFIFHFGATRKEVQTPCLVKHICLKAN